MSGEAACIFCKIVGGEAPGFKVCEDALTVTFLDVFPVAVGHTLVVTREHFENLFEISPEALAAVTAASARVAKAIRKELNPDGLGVFQLNGAAAGQSVFHYHMHLIPRSTGEGFNVHGRVRGQDQELSEMAARLRAALGPDGS
jgi:histidine triad (HIT) family protein